MTFGFRRLLHRASEFLASVGSSAFRWPNTRTEEIKEYSYNRLKRELGTSARSEGNCALAKVALMFMADVICVHGGSLSTEQMFINGRPYVRLSEWAKANDLQVHWGKRDETLE